MLAAEVIYCDCRLIPLQYVVLAKYSDGGVVRVGMRCMKMRSISRLEDSYGPNLLSWLESGASAMANACQSFPQSTY